MFATITEFFQAHAWAGTLLRVAATLAVTYILALCNRAIWRRQKNSQQVLFRRFIFYIVQVVIYILGVLFAVGYIPALSGIVQTLLAGSGIIALAISLSAQESLNNIISGLFITLFHPFEVGDRVTLISAGITGTVEDLTLRHTIIKTFTNTRIVVPNSTMNKEVVENSNLIDARASNFIDVSVAYEADIERAMEIMADVIGSHPLFWDVRPEEERSTTPKVKVYVRELGASGIALRANMWTKTVNENFAACSDVRLAIKRAFDREGIEIPYTKYTILHQD